MVVGMKSRQPQRVGRPQKVSTEQIVAAIRKHPTVTAACTALDYSREAFYSRLRGSRRLRMALDAKRAGRKCSHCGQLLPPEIRP